MAKTNAQTRLKFATMDLKMSSTKLTKCDDQLGTLSQPVSPSHITLQQSQSRKEDHVRLQNSVKRGPCPFTK